MEARLQADHPNDLAAGLELKFLVFRAPCPGQGGGSVASETYASVASTIEHARPGERAISICDIKQQRRTERDFWETHWIVKKANSAGIPDDDARHHSHAVVPVEVCSPKLLWKAGRASWARVEAVLRAVRERHHVEVNHTCDVHLHLGRRDGHAFLLPTLKRIATMAWLAEPALRTVRDPRSPNYHNVYTWGAEVRLHSRLAAIARSDDIVVGGREAPVGSTPCKSLGLPGTAPAGTSKALWAIQVAPTYLDLGRLLSGPAKQFRRLGCNFSAFGEEDERAKTSPRTVELRILDGTLDAALVTGWLHIACTLVGLALTGENGYTKLVRHLQETEHIEALPADIAFAGLMTHMGVAREHYGAFLDKIRFEHGLRG